MKTCETTSTKKKSQRNTPPGSVIAASRVNVHPAPTYASAGMVCLHADSDRRTTDRFNDSE